MAVLTNLASTLTARYFPSKTLTDAFYLDGRLFGKREARQADITIEKNERGYFLSVFAHPKLPNYEPGMMPPYEPVLRGTCNEVKFGHKEIDEMIEGFLTTAVDVTGKARIAEADDRTPYFSGIIVRDSEAFAVTIGTGLAFLYRDDTLYPLTDAGIPMEPIDAKGNRVADFLYYCSSKTANALWSNFFTLAQDDCIILCNKEVYDALGQREILRILYEADDQCDAAGVIITQASARMPDVPMQFAISFVEDVVSDEKKGLFGFRKKAKEEDTSSMSIQSTFDGGLVGAAANAAAASGFAGSMTIDDYNPQGDSSFVMFGDNGGNITPPPVNQQATPNQGIVVDEPSKDSGDSFVQFLDPSVNKDVSEVSAEDVMKTLFSESVKNTAQTASAAASVEAASAAASAVAASAAVTAASEAAKTASDSVFVNDAVNPFTGSNPEPSPMKTVSTTNYQIDDSDTDKTKPVERLDAAFMARLEKEAEASKMNEVPKTSVRPESDNPFVASVSKMASEEPVMEPSVPEPVVSSETSAFVEPEASLVNTSEESPFVAAAPSEPENLFVASTPEVKAEPAPVPAQPSEGTFVFSENEVPASVPEVTKVDTQAEFDPYSVGNGEEMQNAEPPVFGDSGVLTAPTDEELEEASSGIPVPEFDIKSEEPQIEESDKLGVEFPVSKDDRPEKNNENIQPETGNDFSLPFENEAQTVNDIPEPSPEQIPEMPVYGANEYQSPTAASGADVPVNKEEAGVYAYGQMVGNENMAPEPPVEQMPVDYGFGSPAPATTAPSAGNSSYEALSPTQYGTYDENPYVEGNNGYTPGQYQEGYEPVDGAPSDGDDAWINSILGIDESAFDMAGTASAVESAAGGMEQGMEAGGAVMGDNNSYGYGRQPGNPGAPQMQRRSGSVPQKPRTSASGNGGNGGGSKRRYKLNRNGYMFLAFVIVCIVCLIILISAIIRSCGKEGAEVTETSADAVTIETQIQETTPPTVETTVQDPSYPIGRFQFSEYIGYRTWWDLFNNVYGINDIANTSDPRIQIILSYNGLDASYTPSTGDQLLLPPVGVLDGTIPVTFQVGSTTSADSTTSVSGEVQTVDGATETEPSEVAAETEAPAV